MTLKEKFEQYAKQEVWEKRNYNSEECEQIADEYATGFADYLMKTRFQSIKNIKTEKLLELYKQEKGL